MSELFNRIKKESISLRKDRDAKAPFSTYLISVINSYTKDNQIEIDDDAVIRCIRSSVKKLNDADKASGSNANAAELSYLAQYLPSETSLEDINAFLKTFFSEVPEVSMKLMGGAMAKLKQNFGSDLNPATASKAVKEYIQSHAN